MATPSRGDFRPAPYNIFARPGRTVVFRVSITGTGYTEAAATVTLGDEVVVPTVTIDTVNDIVLVTVSLTSDQTTSLGLGAHDWALDLESGIDIVHVLAGSYVGTMTPRSTTDGLTVAVTADSTSVSVQVLAGASSSAVASYTHDQAVASTTWTINHNLGYRPVVGTFTTGGVEIEGAVSHTSVNQAVVVFSGAQAGFARLV